MRYGYIFTRLAEMLPVLLIVVVATFFLAHAVPGGPFEKDRRMPPEVKKRLEEYYGLDKPLASQLVTYVGNLCKGDLGPSLKYPGWSVNEIIGSRIPVSVQLGLTALLLVPSFVLGPLFALVFALGLGWFPPCGWGSPIHFVLPALTLGIVTAAPLARLTRGKVIEAGNQDYVRTARAKGLPERRVWFVHALRNGILPVVTYLGPAAAGLVSGSFVVESLFDVPGLGRLFVSSIINRDFTLILGTTLVYAAALLVLNLVADLAKAALDPRVARGGDR